MISWRESEAKILFYLNYYCVINCSDCDSSCAGLNCWLVVREANARFLHSPERIGITRGREKEVANKLRKMFAIKIQLLYFFAVGDGLWFYTVQQCIPAVAKRPAHKEITLRLEHF